ncbi:hypothetical protein NDU88_009276 [Pleurodeles waltl]|uniref:Uncharacterized protein n=1 Tax=Pleurodeles waltl TaxID=8319 RepID=A0AAV7NYK2_PLEWA|nr:hypothetical protein NDU88_009276 [Pleurodeles waltl]
MSQPRLSGQADETTLLSRDGKGGAQGPWSPPHLLLLSPQGFSTGHSSAYLRPTAPLGRGAAAGPGKVDGQPYLAASRTSRPRGAGCSAPLPDLAHHAGCRLPGTTPLTGFQVFPVQQFPAWAVREGFSPVRRRWVQGTGANGGRQ